MVNIIKIPLKTFWEIIEQKMSALTPHELHIILRTMAKETPPTQRQAFIDKLTPVPDEMTTAVEKVLEQKELMEDINKIVDELKVATEEADSWEEPYERNDYHDEDVNPGHYQDFVDPLTALFDRTQGVFDHGNPVLALAAYHKLFEVFSFEDDYGNKLHDYEMIDVDVGEARARYLRAVYETEPLTHRPEEMFDQMQQMMSWFTGPRPMMYDVIQISPEPLPELDHFFKDWIAFLEEESGNDADTWLREAIYISRGTQGLEELARKEGRDRPFAYLDWFAGLEEEGRYRELLDAAKEALHTLDSKLHIRADIAEHLYTAAVKLDDLETQRTAQREAFAVEPTLVRLLDLWETTPDDERTKLMNQAVQHVKRFITHQLDRLELPEEEWYEDLLEQPIWVRKSLLAHSYLLAGDWDAVLELAVTEEVVGWSAQESSQGLIVTFFLVMLSGKRLDSLPPNLEQIWHAALMFDIDFDYWGVVYGEGETSMIEKLMRAYAERLAATDLFPDKQEELLSWCLAVAQLRVNTIVERKYRNSYEKAATLIAACAEVLVLRGDARGAEEIVNEIRGRFPRHRSFQAALTKQLTK